MKKRIPPQQIIRDLKMAGIRQGVIAKAIGVSDPYLSQVKHGTRTLIRVEQIDALEALRLKYARRIAATKALAEAVAECVDGPS